MRRLGIYEKTPSKKKKYQPTEWITEKFPEEKVQIDVKFVQKEYMSPELQEKWENLLIYNNRKFTRLRYTLFTKYMSAEFVKRLIKYYLFKVETIQAYNGFEFTNRLSWNAFMKKKDNV